MCEKFYLNFSQSGEHCDITFHKLFSFEICAESANWVIWGELGELSELSELLELGGLDELGESGWLEEVDVSWVSRVSWVSLGEFDNLDEFS